VDADSEEAALFELWSAEMAIAVRDAMVPAALREAIPVVHPHVVLALVLGEDKRLADRTGLAQAALDRAAALLAVRPAGRRRWGDLHRLELRHTLSALIPGADISAGGSGGDGSTVMARWWAGLHATQVSGGASFAAVIDLGRWEAARGINLPGQSGDPRSRHYGDLAPLWIEGRSMSLAVDGIEASEVVRLVPG
jgi:penicillin amidase